MSIFNVSMEGEMERWRDEGMERGRKGGRKEERMISTLEESTKNKVGDRKKGGAVSCTAYITLS